MPLFVVMGVSGSGKTTVGRAVAQEVAAPFFEGDDYHPPANVAKMSAGIPLQDADRVQWIDDLMNAINASPASNVVVACSALTRSVRTRIMSQSTRLVRFVHLAADPMVVQQRLDQRGQHFMKPGMLPSQLATLERPEEAFVVDASRALPDVCRTIVTFVKSHAD